MKRTRYKYSRIFRAIYAFLGFTYSEISDLGDYIVISLRRFGKTSICPVCGRRNKHSAEYQIRIIRDSDLGPKKCFLKFNEYRIYCKCGFKGYERLSFVRPYARYSIRFEESVYRLCPHMSITDVANFFDIDWKTVKDIDIHYTKERIKPLAELSPRRIGVDEVAYAKGQKYLTIVRDIDLGLVIWIGLGRKKETLDLFFAELGFIKSAQITVVTMDMWDPYIASVNEHCPGADIVFDKFHIVKIVSEALDKVRKMLFENATDEERKSMKRKRWLILRRNDRLDDEQKQQLKTLMKKNKPLYKAYLLKEHLSNILDGFDLATAVNRLEGWFKNIDSSKLEPFQKCAETIRNHLYGVLNYFRHLVTNAGSEGLNNKINLIKRRAYGYTDIDYFKMKIFQACGVISG